MGRKAKDRRDDTTDQPTATPRERRAVLVGAGSYGDITIKDRLWKRGASVTSSDLGDETFDRFLRTGHWKPVE